MATKKTQKIHLQQLLGCANAFPAMSHQELHKCCSEQLPAAEAELMQQRHRRGLAVLRARGDTIGVFSSGSGGMQGDQSMSDMFGEQFNQSIEKWEADTPNSIPGLPAHITAKNALPVHLQPARALNVETNGYADDTTRTSMTKSAMTFSTTSRQLDLTLDTSLNFMGMTPNAEKKDTLINFVGAKASEFTKAVMNHEVRFSGEVKYAAGGFEKESQGNSDFGWASTQTTQK